MRYKLKLGEKIDEFVSRCQAKAYECDFANDGLTVIIRVKSNQI